MQSSLTQSDHFTAGPPVPLYNKGEHQKNLGVSGVTQGKSILAGERGREGGREGGREAWREGGRERY